MKKLFTFVMALCASAMMFADDVYTSDFTKGLNSWTIQDKDKPEALSYVWKQDEKFGMKASAFVSSTAYASESWVVSPAIDLTKVTVATLKVNQAVNKSVPTNLAIKVSTDNGESWTKLSINMPEGSSWDFQDDEVSLDAYAGQSIKLALVYVSTTSVCPTWEVKTLNIYSGTPTPPTAINVTGALTIAKAMSPAVGKTETTSKTYAVSGYVVGISTTKTNTYFMSDTIGAYGEFQAFQCVTVDSEVSEDDYVTVTGKIDTYHGQGSQEEFYKYEISGGTLVHSEAPLAIPAVWAEESYKKAFKTIENGQIVIIRNGVKYNTVGAVVE